MASGADFFLNKTLGKDFLESLEKVELWKPGTRTVVDHEEMRTALQIVPRTVLALLIKELAPLNVGENKEIDLPVKGGAVLSATKHERDVYTGHIRQGSKVLVDFKHRPLPGIGLIVMSTFELYDASQIANNAHLEHKPEPDIDAKVQKLIDERLALHDLIGKVIDKKIMEREAIDKLVLMKLTEAMAEAKKDASPPKSLAPFGSSEMHKKEKGSDKLKKFIDERNNKIKKNEFSIQLAKGEVVSCPDCGKSIFDGHVFSGCVCLGDDREKKIFIKKTEEGIKVRFGKGWDTDNIEMLLEVLRKKHE